MRPSVQELAPRLAGAAGPAVVPPDLFCRARPYDPVDPGLVFTNPELRDAHREQYIAAAYPGTALADTGALLAMMDAAPGVAAGPTGVTGFCMAGRLAPGTFRERIAAAASCHGGGRAGDAPASPHLLAPGMTAKVDVAGAIEDARIDDAEKARLEQALGDPDAAHRGEIRPARHGRVPRDMPVHDPVEADHHRQRLIPLRGGAGC